MTERDMQASELSARLQLTRRGVLGTTAIMAVAATVTRPRAARAQDIQFCAALGWTRYESGQSIVNGYKDAIARLGGTLKIADANYDVKRQSDQITAFVASKPAAIFITPADASAISPAVHAAVESGIPIFCGDSFVPYTTVTSTAMSNNFGMGAYGAQFIADRLGGRGTIAMVNLPANESWDQRTLGVKSVLLRYPNIKVASESSFALGGSTTPRQIVDNILTANPKLDAIWCAWDGAATEGALAIKAAGRDVFITGIDGGHQSFEYIKAGSPFVLTLAQSFYEMAFLNALYAHEVIAGRKAPRFIITPVYAVTNASLANKPIPTDYDHPGEAEKLGWTRAL